MEHKLAIWSDYFKGLSCEEKVDSFLECGIDYIELSDECGSELLSRGDARKVGRAYGDYARSQGMTVSQGHLNLYVEILNPVERETLKTWLDLFEAVGIKRCVLHYASGKSIAMPAERMLHARAEALKELVAYIQDTDMVLCLENLSARDDGDCKNLLRLIDAAGGGEHLGICLDTGHLNLARSSQSAFINQAGDLLKALHIADNEGYLDQHIMPYGNGTVDWTDTMRALNRSNYDGLFNMEIPGERPAPLQVRKYKLEYIRKMSEYLFAIK